VIKFLRKVTWGAVYLRYLSKHRSEDFKIFTHLTKIERLLLYKLALSLNKHSTIVEIGSYLGASSSFLASAAKEKNHTLYCIDTWSNEGMSEGGRDTFDEFHKNTEQLKKFIIPLRGRSVDIAGNFDKKIDLAFIDGDHSYEGVKADVESWLPKVKEVGILIFHDIGWAVGVKRVIDEYIKPIQVEGCIIDNTYWAKIKK
jgi:predicted O-methyltransferase YrrM